MRLETRYTRPMPAPAAAASSVLSPRPLSALYSQHPHNVTAGGRGTSIDSYNCLLQSPQGAPVEYWTNGRTTLLMHGDDGGGSSAPYEATASAARNHGNRGAEDGSRYVSVRRMSTATKPPWVDDDRSFSSLSSTGGSAAASEHRLVRDSILAGSVSGMASTVALYPMDLLRTRLQQTAGSAALTSATAAVASSTPSPSTASWRADAAIRSGVSALQQPLVSAQNGLARTPSVASPWSVFRQVLREGGFRGLYTGMTLPVAAQAVYKATVFTVNNVTQECLVNYRTLENHKLGRISCGELTFLDRFASGCLGGAVNAWLFVTPVEFVRNQMISLESRRVSNSAAPRPAAITTPPPSSSSPMSSWGVIRSSVRNHGLSSLWRGASWSIARDGWGCGWFFVTMHYAQEYWRAHGSDASTPSSMAARIAWGGLAGLAFWVASLPLDTIKTWIQSADLSQRQMVVRDTIQQIQLQEGVQGVIRQLFRGWQVAYGRGIPSAAITISVYSWVYDSLQVS